MFDEMLGLVLHIAERLAAPLPSRGPTTFSYYFSFQGKATLYRYLCGVYDESAHQYKHIVATWPSRLNMARKTPAPHTHQRRSEGRPSL